MSIEAVTLTGTLTNTATVDIIDVATFAGATPKLAILTIGQASTTNADMFHNYGVATATSQWSVSSSLDHNVGTTVARHAQSSTNIIYITTPSGTLHSSWSLSFIADGVRLTRNTWTADVYVSVEIVGGSDITVTSGAEVLASAAAVNVTSTGVDPTFVICGTGAFGGTSAGSRGFHTHGIAGDHQGLGTIKQQCHGFWSANGLTTSSNFYSARTDSVCHVYNISTGAYDYGVALTALGTAQFTLDPITTYGADAIYWTAVELTGGYLWSADQAIIASGDTSKAGSDLGGQRVITQEVVIDGTAAFDTEYSTAGYGLTIRNNDNIRGQNTVQSDDDGLTTTVCKNGVYANFAFGANTATFMEDDSTVFTATPSNLTDSLGYTAFSGKPANSISWQYWGIVAAAAVSGVYEGSTDITAIYEGSTEITGVYEGTTVIF